MEMYLATRPGYFTVYFEDLKSGCGFGIREGEPMVAASTVKLPLVLYINTLAVEGKIGWDTPVAYREITDYEDGCGVLRYEAKNGDRYTVRVLTNLAVTISDNIAFRMLARHVGRDKFSTFMKNLGGRTVYPDGKNLTTARDLGLYVRATLAFAQRYPDLGDRLLDDLAHSIYHVGLPGLLPAGVTVAHKEGDLEGIANDAGVVFAARPFLMAVLSRDVPSSAQGFADIAVLSKLAYDFQQASAKGYNLVPLLHNIEEPARLFSAF